ncbi:hypothetical protein DET61_1111 [Marinobacter nauticus]|jgi:hypothetical protein|uniref:Uncharacterized protein n=1 Tax=Marinobacter nauticus TaxID=2743 RepID=A0A368XD59_MARNT|nr:hypothetical protein [Marinobacter nauticus]RCW65903.1 hypothetical protein DET61_1111 [Marinobacter nauticus]
MLLDTGLKTYTEYETRIHVAPTGSTIAVSLNLNGRYPGKISEPFTIKDDDYSTFTCSENDGEKMNLKIGRYLQTVELEIIKKKTRDFLGETKLTGNDLREEIRNIVKSVKLEFDNPTEPSQVIPDEPIDGDPEFLIYATDDDLAKFAYTASELCVPYMHPWDAYEYLLLLRKKARGRTVIDLNSYF